MAEQSVNVPARAPKVRHRGRGSQVVIYLGKQFRFFINENDWKVLPMAAVIAGLVGMVIRSQFFVTMEGSLFGAFALTCVAIWNGCFNSIQSVCRERPIIKREHRSGLHISAYVAAHMIYQLLLCAAQTGLTMYVLTLMEVRIPLNGFMTPYMVVDIGISMFLISYASDMMSLFLSSVSRTTTGAMTVMPFVLIFQLVFSGGIIPLPEWSRPLSNYTVSNYGIKAIAAQSGYNELPMVTFWNTLNSMRGKELSGTVTVGQLLDLLDSPAVQKRSDEVILKTYTVDEVTEIFNAADEELHLREKEIAAPVSVREIVTLLQTGDAFSALRERVVVPAMFDRPAVTVGTLLGKLLDSDELQPLLDREVGFDLTVGEAIDILRETAGGDTALNEPVTIGMLADYLKRSPLIQAQRDREFTVKGTVGDLFELLGEENVKSAVQRVTAEAAHKPQYERSVGNIAENWIMLLGFVLLFALLSVIVLERIDKDRR